MTNKENYLKQLLQEIQAEKNDVSLMEVCGTHTMAIARSGIRGPDPT